MTIYTVHLPPDATTPERVAEKAVFVKDGFSMPAFIFTGLWLLGQRLWLHAIAYFVVFGLTIWAFYALGLPRIVFGGVTALLALLIGLEGHEWMRRRFARKGWTHAGTVSGPSLDECERRFFQDWVAARGSAASPRPSPPPSSVPAAGVAPQGVLGVFPEARGRT
ncbi:MAG: DUF2628 domain-containing protein [Beijerinckiaceae bacterium]